VKLNIRISLAGSHLLIGAFSLIGALLTLYKVPTSFGTIQVMLGEIYYTTRYLTGLLSFSYWGSLVFIP